LDGAGGGGGTLEGGGVGISPVCGFVCGGGVEINPFVLPPFNELILSDAIF